MVTVGVQNDCQAIEIVFGAKDRASLHTVPGIPDSHTISKEILSMAKDMELYLQLPVP